MLLLHKKDKNLRKKIITILFSLFLLISLSAGYQNAYAGANVPSLVETQWLADNLKNPDMRIVYVGGFSPKSMADFGGKHIPGSVYVSSNSVMKILGNGSTPPDKAGFEALMGRLGIKNDTHVVIYGSGANPLISTVFWLMEYFDHEKISYLNGGIAKWTQEKHKTATGAPAQITAAKYTAVRDESIRADADYVLQNLKNPKDILVDTRGLDVYKGTRNEVPSNKRTGHIPGAVNLNFYSTNLKNDGTFKSAKDLKAVYEAKGVTKDKEAITYCQGGVRAAHTYFVLKHLLGYPKVRNYVGSWGEWANLDAAKYPIEK
ncbi:MAG TPA: sulfurtransferase [Nitrospirae bacterium]|nr:thiosulfate sulfurtransferase [bacterium BMS3Bbin09]HDO25953.1 sulfurtransferase [Nitrospirota bacterium]